MSIAQGTEIPKLSTARQSRAASISPRLSQDGRNTCTCVGTPHIFRVPNVHSYSPSTEDQSVFLILPPQRIKRAILVAFNVTSGKKQAVSKLTEKDRELIKS